MAHVDPLPIEIAIPEIPDEIQPLPGWTQIEPTIWIHEPIPLEIEFPISPIEVPLRIRIGRNTFVVPLALTEVAVAQG